MLRELVRRGEQFSLLCVKVDFELVGMRLAVLLCEFHLRVEEVHLPWSAVLEQADDGLRLGGEMRRFRRQWIRAGSVSDGFGVEMCERQSAERSGRAVEECPAGEREWVRPGHREDHSTYRNALLANSI